MNGTFGLRVAVIGHTIEIPATRLSVKFWTE
jgi:hypothetical protein